MFIGEIVYQYDILSMLIVNLYIKTIYFYEVFMKNTQVLIRLSEDEKKSFEMCAKLAGVPLSSWMRERLRADSVKELRNVNIRAPFIDSLEMKS